MTLVPDEVLAVLPKLYSQEKKGNRAIAHVRFHSLALGWDWYATEYDPKERIFFGLVKGYETELGYFSLDELTENGVFRVADFQSQPLTNLR